MTGPVGGASDWRNAIEVNPAAVAFDHAHGLHDGHDDGERCTYPGCERAYFYLAEAAENDRKGTT